MNFASRTLMIEKKGYRWFARVFSRAGFAISWGLIAKHAVIEVAILATRLDFLPIEEVAVELFKFKRIVEKTSGAQELEAFALLEARIRDVATQRGFDMDRVR